MLKRLICLFVLLISIFPVFAEKSSVSLSDMTLDELEALKNEIENEIENRKANTTASTSTTSTKTFDSALSWALTVSDNYQSSCAEVASVKRINSEVLGQDMCFIIDFNCNHSRVASQFVHLNDVLIPICQSMSFQKSIDSVSFTIFDHFIDKYGNTKRTVAITASYRIDTLQKINYEYFKKNVYAYPTAFIKCADSSYISPVYGIE